MVKRNFTILAMPSPSDQWRPSLCRPDLVQETMEKQQNEGSDNRNLLENIILLEILSRLPVKSLLRFMCVCRHWKSLISSQAFRKLHSQRHNSSPPLILALHSSDYDNYDNWVPGMLFDYYLTTFDLYGKVIQQCTLPISSSSLHMMYPPSQSKLVFFIDTSTGRCFSYNPSTRHFFHLPAPPCFSFHSPGFGYIPSKDEYVLMHIVNTENKWVVEVLTMSISYENNYQLHYNAWRFIEVTIMLGHGIKFFGPRFVCGAFYFGVLDENRNNFILSFDVETEVFSTFEYPQGGDGAWGTSLMELKDELCFANGTSYTSPTLYLWKLSDVNNKLWTLKWNINLQSLGFPIAPPPDVFDCVLFIYRLEYLQCHNEPSDILRDMGRLKLEGEDYNPIVLESEDYYACVGRDWYGKGIHTNLFTL